MKTDIRLEIDRTIAQGKTTLFVKGNPDNQILAEILNRKRTSLPQITHIHFGEGSTFNPEDHEYTWEQWANLIFGLLEKNYWVSLEINFSDCLTMHEYGFCEYHKFIPKIIVDLPYINLLNYNTVIKISSSDGKSNPGTWTTYLAEVTAHENFIPNQGETK